MGIVDKLPRPPSVLLLGLGLNIIHVRLEERESSLLILLALGSPGEQEHDTIARFGVLVETHDIASVLDALVGDGLGDGLEHAERVELGLVAGHKSLEILVELVELVDDVDIAEVRRLSGTKILGNLAQLLSNGCVSLNIGNSIVAVERRGLDLSLCVLDSSVEDGAASDSGEICPVDDAAGVFIIGDVGGEIGILIGIGFYNITVGKNDLPAGHGITGHSLDNAALDRVRQGKVTMASTANTKLALVLGDDLHDLGDILRSPRQDHALWMQSSADRPVRVYTVTVERLVLGDDLVGKASLT
ncbi:hypothetical protein HG530_002299 [Fusarium avenaceum]|nr:hypothetical protein HG530_002299 [Fusarium avenaceum]